MQIETSFWSPRGPDAAFVQLDNGWKELKFRDKAKWEIAGVQLKVILSNRRQLIELEALNTAVRTIKLRWKKTFIEDYRVLCDQWERAYGDLQWSGIVPERIMPWYFLVFNGSQTNGLGVKTGANAFCYWQMDCDGITFTADVSNGSQGVLLGNRKLQIAEIVHHIGEENETPFITARKFCSIMCENPVNPRQPVYGGNNWYYAYGNSSHEEIIEDSKFISSLASNLLNRPFMVIDDGWQFSSGGGACNGGPWTGNLHFSDMEGLAGEMKNIGVKPGLWFRPLLTSEQFPQEWIRYSTKNGHVLDPSLPEVLGLISESVQRMNSWGFNLLKHDFTTFDLFGQFGYTMKSKPNTLSHSFYDQSKTTAEITLGLYRAIADASREMDVIGCNTVGHLAAGIFGIQRTGDDTSGKWWERTRYMGVNTLAFRMPQHGTFFSHDADCVGLTKQVPWEMNQQWLQLIANSGTPLFVSVDPAIVTKKQEIELRNSFELASKPQVVAEPLDWMRTTCPSHWLLNGEARTFEWNRVSVDVLDGNDNGWWI